MSHAKNEGPGGCVPWEEHEALKATAEELRRALRVIQTEARQQGFDKVLHVATNGIAHCEPPPGSFVSIAANRAMRAHEAEIQWDIGRGRRSTCATLYCMPTTPTSFRLDDEALTELDRLDALIRERYRREAVARGESPRRNRLVVQPNRTEALTQAVFLMLTNLERELDIPMTERIGLDMTDDVDDGAPADF